MAWLRRHELTMHLPSHLRVFPLLQIPRGLVLTVPSSYEWTEGTEVPAAFTHGCFGVCATGLLRKIVPDSTDLFHLCT